MSASIVKKAYYLALVRAAFLKLEMCSPRYFEDDEEESSSADLPYIPAENSPTRKQFQSGGGGGGSDSEDDPLDAFMAEVEVRGEMIYFRTCVVFCCHFTEFSLSDHRTKQQRT